MRARHLRLAALFVASTLIACAQPDEQAGGESVMEEAGTEPSDTTFLAMLQPSCKKPGKIAHTRPLQHLEVVDGSIDATPDTVVQPPAGWLGWQSLDGYAWRITFKEGDYPTEEMTYSGGPNEPPVFAQIRADAPCRYYAWEIEMWQPDDSAATYVSVDPGGVVEPWGGGG